MNKNVCKMIIPMVLALFGFILFAEDASAKVNITQENLYKLSLLQGLQTCYGNARSEITKDYFSGLDSIFDDYDNGSSVLVTTHVGNNLSSKKGFSDQYKNDSDLSCKQTFNGYKEDSQSGKGLNDYYNLPGTLEGLGYTFSSDSFADSTGAAVIKLSGINGDFTKEVTTYGDGLQCTGVLSGQLWTITSSTSCENDGKIGVSVEGDSVFELTYNRDTGFTINGEAPMNSSIVNILSAGVKKTNDADDSYIKALQNSVELKEAFINDIGVVLSSLNIIKGLPDPTSDAIELSIFEAPGEAVSGAGKYRLVTYDPSLNNLASAQRTAAGKVLNSLNIGFDDASVVVDTGVGRLKTLYWPQNYKYALYYYYILDAENLAKNKGDAAISMDNCGSEKPDAEYLFKNSADIWCAVNITGTGKDDILNTYYNVVGVDRLGSGTFKDVLEWFSNEDNYTDVKDYADLQVDENGRIIDDVIADEYDGRGVEENIEGDETKTTCMNAGGAQKLGWIVCTVMELLGTAAQDAYEDIVEPSLRVEPQLFSGGNGGVRGAWETFRNFANIAFIILFLVVIFSQLTGVGIDNYGIKKILPKLIVVAILINLSYVLCIVMVDLSNILGNALRGLFDGLGAGLNPSLSIPNSDVNMDSEALTSTVITGVAILGALVAMGGMIWRNPAIVLSLLVAALGVAVSIFFLFVLLAIREAAIVVLVAIAPLAVVCYALPNTKKLFDKWWKFFEGLLLVYPICGLLVGGGNYVSKLLLTSGFAGGSFLQGLTAMIVGIVPIFFIPTVLKGSFAAMGKVGGMLTGMGDRARKGATGRVRGSEAYKNAQKMGLDRKMRYKAGYSERKGGLTATGRLKSKVAQSRFGRMTGMNKRQAAYVETAKKNADIGKESTAILMSEAAAADLAHSGMAPKDYFQDKIDKVGTDIRKLDSVISAAQKRGVKNKDIMAMIRKSSNSGNLRFANDASRLNWMNSMLQNHNDITSTDFEGQEWMRAGGGGALGNYGDYAAGHLNASDIDISDLSKIAGNSMAGLIKAGMISKSVAQQWLVANPNASPDKKIMMGAVACGAVTAANLAGMNAEIFKNEAEALANGTTPGTNVIETGVNAVNADLASRGRNIITLEDRVASWTAQQQARTYISQDASSMAPGQLQREDNPVFVHEVGAPSSDGGGFGGRYPDERARMENEAARQAGLDVPHDDSAS